MPNSSPAAPSRRTPAGGGHTQDRKAAAGLNHSPDHGAAPAPGVGSLPLTFTREDFGHHLRITPRSVNRYVAMGILPPPDIKRSKKFVRWKRQTVLDAIDRLATDDAPFPE